jgi:hypothetical protein
LPRKGSQALLMVFLGLGGVLGATRRRFRRRR